MFNALSAVKFVASGVVGLGTGKIVDRIIRNNITPETLVEKVSVTAAAWVIGAMAAKATKQYTDEMIDENAKLVTDAVTGVKTNLKLAKINKHQSTFEDEGLNESDFIYEAKTDGTPGKWIKPKIVTSEPTLQDLVKAQYKKSFEQVEKTMAEYIAENRQSPQTDES